MSPFPCEVDFLRTRGMDRSLGLSILLLNCVVISLLCSLLQSYFASGNTKIREIGNCRFRDFDLHSNLLHQVEIVNRVIVTLHVLLNLRSMCMCNEVFVCS